MEIIRQQCTKEVIVAISGANRMVGRLDQMPHVWVAQHLVVIFAVRTKFLDQQSDTLSCRCILIILSVDEEDLPLTILNLEREEQVEQFKYRDVTIWSLLVDLYRM